MKNQSWIMIKVCSSSTLVAHIYAIYIGIVVSISSVIFKE